LSATVPGSLILIGPPGAGCSSVARAIGSAQGLTVLDLGRLVADELGTRPDLALVAAPETEYRRIEAGTAERLLERAETGARRYAPMRVRRGKSPRRDPPAILARHSVSICDSIGTRP